MAFFSQWFTRRSIDGTRMTMTVPKRAVESSPVFSTFVPSANNFQRQDWWEHRIDFGTWSPRFSNKHFLRTPLVAPWSVEIKKRTRGHLNANRRYRVDNRWTEVKIWLGSDEDLVLLKLMGLLDHNGGEKRHVVYHRRPLILRAR